MNASPDKAEEERSRSSSFKDAAAKIVTACPTPGSLFWAGVFSMPAAGGIIWFSERVGLLGAKPVAELLLALLLMRVFPQKLTEVWSLKRVFGLLGLGVVLALFWMMAIAWGNTRFPDLSAFSRAAIITGVVSAVVTAPIYEEKVVRHLLLDGLAGYTKGWIAAVLVSVAFALAHQESMVWSFFVSIVLCWLATVKRIGVMQRAIVHGTINALIMAWYFTHGFGVFS